MRKTLSEDPWGGAILDINSPTGEQGNRPPGLGYTLEGADVSSARLNGAGDRLAGVTLRP